MVTLALIAFGINWVVYSAYPDMLGDRWFIVFPFAPLFAGLVLVTATNWTRRVCPSLLESIGALTIVELIALAIVAFIAGALYLSVVFMFWAVASLTFAPWWLLGSWLGRRARRRPRHEF